MSLHVDVSIGDPIWPAPTTITLPRLLEGQIALAGYPLPMVHAEKIVTAIQRGTANTRWRDFADIYMLARRHDVDGHELRTAIDRVAAYRETELFPLEEVLDGYAALAQSRWAAWRHKSRVEDRLPQDFAAVLQDVIGFADPILTEASVHQQWTASLGSWAAR